MIRKPVLGLAGAILAGMTLTGCQNTSPNRSAFNPPAGGTQAASNRNTTTGAPGSNSTLANRGTLGNGGNTPGALAGGSAGVTPAGFPGGTTGTANFNNTPSSYNLNPQSGATGSQSNSSFRTGAGSPSAMPTSGYQGGATSTGVNSSGGFGGSIPSAATTGGPRPDAFPPSAGAPSAFGGDTLPPNPPGRLNQYPTDMSAPSSSSSGVPTMPTPTRP